jgi:farnesyl-diphosphate farnesyltransferase
LKADLSPELFTLLKGTSRSFYLSLRFLPRRIRATLSLAYLLARASDTIADTNRLAPKGRLHALGEFLKRIQEGGTRVELRECIEAQPHGAEKQLLIKTNLILEALQKRPDEHRRLVVEVLVKIVHGQILDIERFELKKGIQSLPDWVALDEYTYLVAGSVGEFWTKLCQLEWPDYSRVPDRDLIRMGINFGKGLQLINIVRDFPADLQNGRSYLPLLHPEVALANPESARPEWDQGRKAARSFLGEAWTYVVSIRPPRVRFACAVPVMIGARTLQLLGQESWIQAGIKVSRSEVRKLVVYAALVGWLPFLEAWVQRRSGLK